LITDLLSHTPGLTARVIRSELVKQGKIEKKVQKHEINRALYGSPVFVRDGSDKVPPMESEPNGGGEREWKRPEFNTNSPDDPTGKCEGERRIIKFRCGHFINFFPHIMEHVGKVKVDREI
jgi:hypothetical protein